MACGGCRGKGKRHVNNSFSLSQFAYLTPRQLRLRKQMEAQEQENESQETEQDTTNEGGA